MAGRDYRGATPQKYLVQLRALTFPSEGSQELEHFDEITHPNCEGEQNILEYAREHFMQSSDGGKTYDASEHGQSAFEHVYFGDPENSWKFDTDGLRVDNTYDSLVRILKQEEVLASGKRPPADLIKDGENLLKLAAHHRLVAETAVTEEEKRWQTEQTFPNNKEREKHFKDKPKKSAKDDGDLMEYDEHPLTLEDAQAMYVAYMTEAGFLEKVGQFAIKASKALHHIRGESTDGPQL